VIIATRFSRICVYLITANAAAIGVLLAIAVADAQLGPDGIAVPKQPAASSTPCAPGRLSVKPIDDLRDDASFQELKRRLTDITVRRDKTELYHLLSPDFFEVGCCEQGPNYRGADAIARFKDMIASNPHLWLQIQQTLQVGVVRTERTYDGYISEDRKRPIFCGPATDSPSLSSCDFGNGRSDPADMAFVIGARVPLRVTSAPSARAITLLAWDVVQGMSPDWSLSPDLVKVRLGDGTIGYVDGRLVHQFLGPKVCFGKEESGQWDIRGIDLQGD
jgi:hypothetical protein